jgi:excisionase family DNA binding protein
MKPKTPRVNSPFMTMVELAERWQLHHSTVARGIREGKLPGVKIGGRYLIRIEWVERFERGEAGFWTPTGEHVIRPTSPFIKRIG